MESNKINRRDWLRNSAFLAGGIGLMPISGLCEMPRKLPRVTLQGKALYSPFFSEYLIEEKKSTELLAKLNANENPYGPSPKVGNVIRESVSSGNRYAWQELMSLMDEIAELEQVKRENVLMAPGSSDILEKTAMVFFKEGGNVVSADPSYMSLIQVAEAFGGTWKPVPLKADWSHDLDAMEAAIDANTKLVYICNPNNPTGTLTPSEELLDFCSRVAEKVTVFVDEAYLGFLKEEDRKSMVSLVNEGKDIIIARTFSKIHGMAGLRVGYAIAPTDTLEKINAITRAGMGISCTSIAAAKASMADLSFINDCRKQNAEVRDFVYSGLKDLGHEPVPSYTSFMIFPIEMEGKDFLDKMYAQGVGVRAFNFRDKNWCRVSMGTLEEMKIFLSAIQKTLI